MDYEDDAVPANANGISQCLRMLAEEAAALRLTRTLSAIKDALEIAKAESGDETGAETDDLLMEPCASQTIH
ncbi:MAG TPA: hypothetical protein VMI52_07525 [Acetobacteraceae bacterium]|nr:hypothetical protein [Acetobacteraceae bacterium]